jgi:hypothetical protein
VAGDRGASPEPGHAGDVPATATSTAARITDTETLIARLEGELAEVDAARAQARETRGEHALAAAEGDAAAVAALQAASHDAARLEVGRENVDMALAAARARLAALEAERRAEEREELRRKNVQLCRERVALAGRIDALLAEMAPLVEQWSALGLTLYGASVMNREPGVVGGHGFLGTSVFTNALPEPVAKALGKNIHVGNRRPAGRGRPGR